MRTFKVAVLSDDRDQLAILKTRVDGTLAAETVMQQRGFPTSSGDMTVRELQQFRPDVIVVDFSAERADSAVAGIELIHSLLPGISIFALSPLNQPLAIINAMRAGACEFLDRNSSSTVLLEAFSRLSTSLQKRRVANAERGKLFTVLSAKGGCGATTVAVNLALSLQKEHGSVALVDLAPLGHTPLHLNAKPNFGVSDAVHNLHRMDATLLEGFMTECQGGLRLLAGVNVPTAPSFEPVDLAQLFDQLLTHYKYAVVDCSNRTDLTSRCVCDHSDIVLVVAQTDVASLWSAGRIREFLGQEPSSHKVQLVINRFRKIAGFSDDDVESATMCKIFWKIPNQFNAIGPAIDRGNPVALQANTEVARSFRELAAALVHSSPQPQFHEVPSGLLKRKEEPQKKILERLISLTPVRSVD